VSIMPGCNGVEACIILVAAMVAYRAPWKDRLIGIVLGCVAVQVLNVARIISLFYLNTWNREVFEWAHLYVWGALIMLDVVIVWLFWVRTLQRRDPVHGT
jgi:exosortase H (IPTLxxWG-CTERM-specific)